ncbi:MAG: hypothetical protein FJ100_18100 [Deltaproteobacteria bacterium]|nr:hypothetical protein [Deltaproteobacteria bacterium]
MFTVHNFVCSFRANHKGNWTAVGQRLAGCLAGAVAIFALGCGATPRAEVAGAPPAQIVPVPISAPTVTAASQVPASRPRALALGVDVELPADWNVDESASAAKIKHASGAALLMLKAIDTSSMAAELGNTRRELKQACKRLTFGQVKSGSAAEVRWSAQSASCRDPEMLIDSTAMVLSFGGKRSLHIVTLEAPNVAPVVAAQMRAIVDSVEPSQPIAEAHR